MSSVSKTSSFFFAVQESTDSLYIILHDKPKYLGESIQILAILLTRI